VGVDWFALFGRVGFGNVEDCGKDLMGLEGLI
jgi:hypothetical protein